MTEWVIRSYPLFYIRLAIFKTSLHQLQACAVKSPITGPKQENHIQEAIGRTPVRNPWPTTAQWKIDDFWELFLNVKLHAPSHVLYFGCGMISCRESYINLVLSLCLLVEFEINTSFSQPLGADPYMWSCELEYTWMINTSGLFVTVRILLLRLILLMKRREQQTPLVQQSTDANLACDL